MYRYIYLLIIILTITGCSEGDIIDVSINFDGELQNCSNDIDNTFVFYKVDADNKRTLSLSFTSTTYDSTPDSISTDNEPTVITLDETDNILIYREFETAINGSTYFCASVPPSMNEISEEYTSTDGTAEISLEVFNDDDPNNIVYQRTITLKNITFIGDDIEIRREELLLGSDTQVVIPQ
ncbi:hypothetical protein GCM10022393_35460 [Aquimarina addita]|uniref:Uncharacterized protein n=1 Tax=Aquimarina addita TaxID=870485 RepID=A0ABP6UT18_9FLAO